MRSKPPKADIVSEAASWFIEFRTEEVTVATRARFHEWLCRSPEHIQAYLEIAEGWAELPTSDPQHRVDIEMLIELARESVDDNVVALGARSATPPQPRRPRIPLLAASFAGVAMLVGLLLWVLLYEANTYQTGVGEQRRVRLADGSTLEINALSNVRVRLSEHAREIDLVAGQALFQVAKDPARPFIVRSGETTVRAVGTQFDVYKKRAGTVVTVLEGRVAVAEANPVDKEMALPEPVFLVAGEQLTVTAAQTENVRPKNRKPRRADVAAATAWVHKQLIFDETPLVEVAEEFNRYSTRRLVIADAELGSLGISGVYSSTQPDSLLGFLRAQPNLQLSETDKEIRVALPEAK